MGTLGEKHIHVDKSTVWEMGVWDPSGDVQQAIGYKSVMFGMKAEGQRYKFGCQQHLRVFKTMGMDEITKDMTYLAKRRQIG